MLVILAHRTQLHSQWGPCYKKATLVGVDRVQFFFFENHPDKIGRNFCVRGSFPSGQVFKMIYATIASKRIRNHQKIFIFEKVTNQNVTLANRKIPKFPWIFNVRHLKVRSLGSQQISLVFGLYSDFFYKSARMSYTALELCLHT